MSTTGEALPSLQIQTVLYKTGGPTVERLLGSVAQTVSVAKEGRKLSTVNVVLGDCSPMLTFSEEEVSRQADRLREAGVDSLHYEFFDANLGSAEGHNRLFDTSDSDLVMILNPDVVTSPYLIDELLLRIHQPQIGLVEGRQLPLEHPKYYDPATGETSWASTACVMIPRKVIREVGRFDSESFFLYCDDVDYSWRIRLAGYKVVFHPPARVFHDKRLNSHASMIGSPAEEYYAAEAALIMTHKWSRPDLTKLFLGGLENGTELQRKAAATFKARLKAGKLPAPLDPEHRVGQFDESGRWAKHRW